jgi:anti-sigma factor RsiW
MMDQEKCWIREQLFAYASHLLEPREADSVRLHVEQCDECLRIVAEFQRLDTVLDEWKAVAPSGAFGARVRAAVASRQSHTTFFGLRWTQVLAPVCLLVLMVTTSVIFLRVRKAHKLNNGSTQTTQIQNASAGQAEEELTLYQNLPVLEDEDYDMLADFDVLSELPRGDNKVAN